MLDKAQVNLVLYSLTRFFPFRFAAVQLLRPGVVITPPDEERGRGSLHSEGLRNFCFVMLAYRFSGREEKSCENRGRAMPFLPLRSNDNGTDAVEMSAF